VALDIDEGDDAPDSAVGAKSVDIGGFEDQVDQKT